MGNIAKFLLIVFIILVASYAFIKTLKSKNEKLLAFILLIIYFSPIVCIYADDCDIITTLGIWKNISIDRWFDFFNNYVSNILSTFISSSVVIAFGLYQLNAEKKQNSLIEQENNRLSLMPLMHYTISKREIGKNTFTIDSGLKTNLSSITTFKIKNCGLGTARNLMIKIKSNNIDESYVLGKQGILMKDEDTTVSFKFLNISKRKFTLKYHITYSDLYKNNYSQDIFIDIDNQLIKDILIKDEKLTNKKRTIK